MQTNKEKIENISSDSAEVLGNAAGGFIGAVLAGPVGAVIGSVSGVLLTKAFKNVGEEIQERFLGPREKHRIEKVIEFAAEKLRVNHERGILTRGESFFKSDSSGRSAAEELLEGVLLAGQKAYEESKLKFIGNLYANLTVSSLDKYQCNFLIRLSESLSYRQLCLLYFLSLQPAHPIEKPQVKDGGSRYLDSRDVLAEN